MVKRKKETTGAVSRDGKKGNSSSALQRLDDILLNKWVNLAFLAALFLIALLVRLSYSKYFQSALTGDAVIYAKIAWGIKNGHGLHWWSVVWSPFYPLVMVFFSIFTGSLETAASAVSLVLGSLLVVPFFFLAKSMFSHRVAYLASILVVFFPALVVISEVPLSEATYAFLLMITLLCGWRFFVRRSYLWAFLFGIFGAICYLTRPEFLVALAGLLLLYLIIEFKAKERSRSNTLALLAVSVVGFLVLALPYINYMHSQTGHWILSGKMAHNILKERAYAQGADYSAQRQALAQVLDGLTPEGQLRGKVLLGQESMFSLLKRPGFFGDYFKRIWLGWKKIDIFFLPFLLFSLFYLFSWKLEKGGAKQRLFLLLSFSPMLTMPVFFTVAGRLIEPYASIIILMTVAGMLNLARLAVGRKARAGALQIGGPVLGAALLVVVLLSVFSLAQADRMAENYQKTYQATRQGAAEFKKLGLWADKTLPKDARVMCLSWDSVLFYCNRQAWPVPFAGWQEIVRFAKENHIGYLLISQSMESSWRKDLAFLLQPLKDRSLAPQDSNVKLVDIYRASSGLGAVLYEFEF
jgi:4-amino-4-deoxy-L-arabinose transferase-like glycosyltransferase